LPVQSPGDFQGTNTNVIVNVLPNSGASRTGAVTIGGQTVTVNQAGGISCAVTLSDSGETFPNAGGTGTLGVAVNPGNCTNWNASSDSVWLTFTSTAGNPNNGAGDGAVNYTVAPNPGAARTGHIAVTGAGSFTVQQLGVPTACDLNQDGKTDVADARQLINEALGARSPVDDLDGDKKITVVDIEIDVNAALNKGCSI
jgi:hypothetical protein